jgi:hypothetical protein
MGTVMHLILHEEINRLISQAGKVASGTRQPRL